MAEMNAILHGLILLAICIVSSTDATKFTSGKLCLTPTCVNTASNLLLSMNSSADPCEDYMTYACGRWAEHNHAPKWRTNYDGTFYKLRDDVRFKYEGLMAEPVVSTDLQAINKVKNMYTACMDQATINKRHGKPLKKYLKSLGGWPVLDSKYKRRPSVQNFDYIDLMSKLSLQGFNMLIYRGVYSGYNDPKMFLQFDQAPLMMDYKFLSTSSDFIYYYREFAKQMARALGATADDYEQQMDDMVDFEIKLAKITESPKNRDWDALYHKYTLNTFKTQVTDKIDMERLINSQLKALNLKEFTANTEFITWAKPEFFKKFADLMAATPKKTLMNYMMFNVVYYTAGYLDDTTFGYIYNDFIDVVWPKKYATPSRKSLCATYTNQAMGWAVSRAFVDRYFDKGAKGIAEKLVEDIRKVFIGMLGKVSWMDAASRQTAQEKARAIKKHVGYPDSLLNNRHLNQMYKVFKVYPKRYFENIVSGWAGHYQNSLRQIGKIQEKQWSVLPTVVNAFYTPSENKISVPAAILQPPFYSKDYPEFLNYAGIGTVLGHELTHGFDSTGKDYDLHGNKRVWWKKEVLAKYKEKSMCFVHQYSKFFIPELKQYLDGNVNLDENIADNGGILESFKAYREYVKLTGKEEDSLPGLNMNNNEAFFVNVAQTFCTEIFTKKSWKYFAEEEHAPDRYRVWGSMINSDDFANTYNCKVGSKMNPRKKCKLW